MSAHCSTRTCSPLKTVLGKIEDRYQAYCTTYKTCTMATHHRGAGCPLDNENSTHEGDKRLMSMSRSWRRTTSRDLGLHRMWTSKSLDSTSSTTSTHTYWTLQRKVIQQYTNTLCTTQKWSNLRNSLLQDTAVFNEHNFTKLEEWLTDIETVADIMNESRPKLAKAKLRGLTCTLVTEAITWDTSWDEIKDLLPLKLCNADNHNYTLCFMEIQQWEKDIPYSIHPLVQDGNLEMQLYEWMQPPSGSSSKDWRIPTV